MARSKHTLPLMKWPGGKFRKSKLIASCLPDHDTYVEPFAGGASVFWNKEPAETEVLSDLNDWLIQFYDDARRGGLSRCKPMAYTRENFESVRDKTDSCSLLMTNHMSFHGGMKGLRDKHPDGKPTAQKILRDRAAYEHRLKKTHLRIADFEDTMQKWDSPETVHYLDPPYTALERSQSYSKDLYDGRDQLPVERVAKVASKMQGKVLISYDDSPRARRAFNKAGLRVYLMPCTRSPGNGGTLKDFELLVTNFELPPTITIK